MKHILDNPAWHALRSGNKHLAQGTKTISYFTPDISPFAALPETTPQNLELLYDTVPFSDPVILISTEKLRIDNPWRLLHRMEGYQMVFTKPVQTKVGPPISITLTEAHVPQMLALTQLTKPGPFVSRTIEFGHYEGIFDGDQLVAMAGQRLHAEEFVEISAVCTHPDYLGKGYARHLIQQQIRHIQAASGIPFLHVRSDNKRAMSVYETMGFETRSEIYFSVLRKQ